LASEREWAVKAFRGTCSGSGVRGSSLGRMVTGFGA